MKIRNGFVSNSSSSSFMIYGAPVSRRQIAKALAAALTEEELAEVPDLAEITDLGDREEILIEHVSDDIIYNAEKKFDGLEFNGGYDWDDLYVGLSWNQIADEETGAQFKARVAGLVAKHFGEKKLATHSEVVYDG